MLCYCFVAIIGVCIEMTISLFLSMAVYALVTSITPGPVNVVALSYGTQYGVKISAIYVTGQATGYTLLLLLIGLGLHHILELYPLLITIIQWAGIAFLLFLAYKFFTDNGQLQTNKQRNSNRPFLYGALMQWLNPKAWLCSVAGIGAYTMQGNTLLVWQFAAIYWVICFLSVGCWAYAGIFLQHFLQKPNYLKRFNQLMALLLIGSAIFLAI